MKAIFLTILYVTALFLIGAWLESSGILVESSSFILYGYLGGLGYAFFSIIKEIL